MSRDRDFVVSDDLHFQDEGGHCLVGLGSCSDCENVHLSLVTRDVLLNGVMIDGGKTGPGVQRVGFPFAIVAQSALSLEQAEKLAAQLFATAKTIRDRHAEAAAVAKAMVKQP